MRSRIYALIALLVTSLESAGASAQSWHRYAASEAAEWQSEFASMVASNYQALMVPKLTAAETRSLAAVKFVYPLDFQHWSAPLGFCTLSDGTVELPVPGLLLLRDLALAEAWLHTHGYSTIPVLDYLVIARTGRLAEWPAHLRSPRAALGIPDSATEDASVMERRNANLSKMVLFVVGHELGHVLGRGIPPRDMAESRRAEQAADGFAMSLFERMGLVPNSAAFLFAVFSRVAPLRSDFSSDAAWLAAVQRSHPLDSARIVALATSLETSKSPAISREASAALTHQMRVLASAVDDLDIARWQRVWAATWLPVDLLPRKDPIPTLHLQPADYEARAPRIGVFSGTVVWATTRAGSFPIELVLRPTASGSSGETMMGPGIRGSVACPANTVDPCTWRIGTNTMTLELSEQKARLTGRYRARDSAGEQGRLRLTRVTAPRAGSSLRVGGSPLRPAGGGGTAALVSTPVASPRVPVAPVFGAQGDSTAAPAPAASSSRGPVVAARARRAIQTIAGFAAHMLAQATARHVYVNGVLLDEHGLTQVDQLNCGESVPDGSYWLQPQRGLWGHVGQRDSNPLPDCSPEARSAPATAAPVEAAEAPASDDCSGYRFYEDRMDCMRLQLRR